MNGITVCNLQSTLNILAEKAEFDDRFVITTVKHRIRDVPVRERCPVLLEPPTPGSSWTHHPTLSSQDSVPALPCPNLAWCWWVASPGLSIAAAKQMALAEFSSPLLSKSSNLCVLLLPSQNWPWGLTGMDLFLRLTKLFLLWLGLTDRLNSSCKAIWQKNKNRQTDSNGMTLISLGNQAKNENVTSYPLLRASPLKARIRKIYPGSERHVEITGVLWLH